MKQPTAKFLLLFYSALSLTIGLGPIAQPANAQSKLETLELKQADLFPDLSDDEILEMFNADLQENPPAPATPTAIQPDDIAGQPAQPSSSLSQVIDESLKTNAEDFSVIMRQLEKEETSINRALTNSKQAQAPGPQTIDNFDEFIRLIEGGDAPPPAPYVAPPVPRVQEEKTISIVRRTQDTQAPNNEEPKKKQGFFEALFGGGFVSREEVINNTNNDPDFVEASKIARQQQKQDADTDYKNAVDEMKTVLGSDYQPVVPSASLNATQAPSNNIARQNDSQAQEYKELVESLTTKIQLLELEKQSLKNAIKKNNRIVLP